MRRCLTLLELLTGLAIVAVLAAIAIPMLSDMQMKAKEAEIRPNLESLVDALFAYQVATDNDASNFNCFTHVGIGKQRISFWTSGPGFDQIGWRPDGDIYGRYIFNANALPATMCEQQGNAGVAGTNGVPANNGPIGAMAVQDLDGDGNNVTYFGCETSPGPFYPIEVKNRTGKHMATGPDDW